jgi:hypothetical protein
VAIRWLRMPPFFPSSGKTKSTHGAARPQEEFMKLRAACLLVSGALLGVGCSVSSAQEIVHAVTGVVTKIDTSAHTITLNENDGTQLVIRDEAANHPRYDFDKTLRSEATDSTAFDKQGDRVILYYFGDGLLARAVAVKDLGLAALKISSGKVTHWDHHHHQVTIKAKDGDQQTFQLDEKTAVETPMGVVDGEKFSPHTGDDVLIKTLDKSGNNEAVFLSES